MSISRSRVNSGRTVSLLEIAPGSIVAWAALSVLFALGCNRSEREPSPAPSAMPASPPVVVEPSAPSGPTADAIPAPATPQPKGEPGTSTACNTAADCRTFSDSCSICSCRPFAKTSPDPKCSGVRMSCLIDPCTGQRVFCKKGVCTLGDPGDAASSGPTPATTKDAASTDAVSKGASSSAPAASAAPKVTDAARD